MLDLEERSGEAGQPGGGCGRGGDDGHGGCGGAERGGWSLARGAGGAGRGRRHRMGKQEEEEG